ncbi:hypothetical protein LEP1GSC074_0323 [Leptospira noguchii str. Hook]|nr:hypothetical protein LEP1GSC041_1185 [Leptospira noguchii str. 2006001870]EMI62341.1 hypothetical protein LEP1GSC072_0770 [Leptospira noguchii str. Bonito]EMS81771.1 hypothetical protein LEP1GSC073_2520 [Leptospira noguchii str. Cascata]EMS89066.1 hypothetical protein LEP1GSC074_0323 [Leptospira noguchii str. Hook]TQE81784.1 hypothetical protein FF021_03440 [Leptospira noguchii]
MKQDPELIATDWENNLKISENVFMILSQFNLDLTENRIIYKQSWKLRTRFSNAGFGNKG